MLNNSQFWRTASTIRTHLFLRNRPHMSIMARITNSQCKRTNNKPRPIHHNNRHSAVLERSMASICNSLALVEANSTNVQMRRLFHTIAQMDWCTMNRTIVGKYRIIRNILFTECDYPQYVVACGGTPPDPTTTPTPAPPINAPAFDCTGRADGLYADQNCNSSYFYSCVGGMSTAMQCSPGLVFDTLNNQCEYKESCGQPK